MNKKFAFVIILGICILGLVRCKVTSNEESVEIESSKNRQKLTIYMPVSVIYGVSEGAPNLYVSEYRIGECWNYTLEYTLYESVIQEFEKEKGIEVEIKYFESQKNLEIELEQNREQGNLPDVVICDASATQSVYSFIAEEEVIDLKPYLNERGSENSYFNIIEEACSQGKYQRILPLLFNINALYTAEENNLDSEYLSYEDVLLLIDEQINNIWFRADVKEAIYAVPTGNPITISYILWNAIGGSGYDFEKMECNLDEEKVKMLFDLMKRYMEFEKEFENVVSEEIPDRSSYINYLYLQPFFQAENSEEASSFYYDYTKHVSYWIDGVAACNWPYTSLALQAQYYSSQLSNSECEFSLLPISKEAETESYNANITCFGFVTSSSINQEAAVELLMYLQNSSVDPRFGFSVNRNVTEEGIEKLTNTSWKLHNFNMKSQELGYVNPLSDELKLQITHILDCIGSASLPNGTIELEYLYLNLENYISGEEWEICYSTLLKQVEQCFKSYSIKSEIESDLNQNSEKEEKICYNFYPKDISKYGKDIIYLGVLNYVSINQVDLEKTWQEWNEYLIKKDSPFVMQLITCSSEKIFDEKMLLKSEEELNIRFDIVSCLGYNFSALDRENYFESLEKYLDNDLKEMYEAVPKEYWKLIEENSHIYNLYDNVNFQSFGFIYEGDTLPEGSEFEVLERNNNVFNSLDVLMKFYKTNMAKVKWNLPDGGATYMQNNEVCIPFSNWSTDTFFDSIAPLVGIEFNNEEKNSEIVCLLDSPTFKKITEFYKLIYERGFYTDGYINSVRIGNCCEVKDSSAFDIGENKIYFNGGINDTEQYIFIRKETNNINYVFDFLNNITSNQEYAKQFYLGNEKSNSRYYNRYRFLNGLIFSESSEIYDAEHLNTLIQQAKCTPLTGFVFDNTNVKDEIEAIQDYLLTSEVYKRIEDIETWDRIEEDFEKLKKDIYELGLQKVIDEANRQYRIWIMEK